MQTTLTPRKLLKVGRLIFWLVLVLGITLSALLAWRVDQLKKEFAEVFSAHPASTAVAAYTFDQAGNLVDDGKALFLNADRPLVMASTMKIVVLAAYADAVDQGEFDAAQRVPVAEWERYYLPNTDGGAHIASLRSLGLEADPVGFARDQNAQVALQDLARVMIHHSDNAATDYLLLRLGESRMSQAIADLGMENHTRIWPITGVALAAFNPAAPLSEEAIAGLTAELAAGDTGTFDLLIERYRNDPAWRVARIEALTGQPAKAPSEAELDELIAYQYAVSELMPRGTAREYARLMAGIASGRLPSAGASALMQDILESNPAEDWIRLIYHNRFGAKPGLTMGVLTCATYATPSSGPLQGKNRVVVILANRMPLGFIEAQVPLDGHYLLQADLARGAGEFQTLVELQEPG